MIRPQGERYLWQCTQPIITFPSMNYCAASSGIKGKFSNIPAGAENCLAANVRSVPVQIVHIKVFQGQFNNLISTWAMLIVTNDNFQNLLHFPTPKPVEEQNDRMAFGVFRQCSSGFRHLQTDKDHVLVQSSKLELFLKIDGKFDSQKIEPGSLMLYPRKDASVSNRTVYHCH